MPQDNEDKWELDFWENCNGNVPIEKVLNKIRKKDIDFYNGIWRKIDQLKKKPLNQLKMPDIRYYQNGLSALRIFTNKKKFRFLGIPLYKCLPPLFESFHAFQKTKEGDTKRELPTALTRLKEFNNFNINKGQK